MFRHVAVLRWKPEADDASKTAFLENFPRMCESIDVIHSWTLGVNVGQGGESHVQQWGFPGNLDLGLTIEFDSHEGYLEYAEHPVHQEFIRDYADKVLGERYAVQHPVE
jgi:hypothetical protein